MGLELGAGGSEGKAEGEKTGIEGGCTERCSSHLKSGIKGTEQAGNQFWQIDKKRRMQLPNG